MATQKSLTRKNVRPNLKTSSGRLAVNPRIGKNTKGKRTYGR
jgi:hypothetical protein